MLGDHKHCRGKKRTDSPGMRGHDPQTQPTAEQQPTLAGSGRVARRLSEAPVTRVAIVGNSRKEIATKYTCMGQSLRRIEVSETEAEGAEMPRACQLWAGRWGGEQRPWKPLSAVRMRGQRTGRRRGQAQKGLLPPTHRRCSVKTVVQCLRRARGLKPAIVHTRDVSTTLSREPIL